MIDFIKENEWSVIEEGYDAKRVMACESIFSIGNGKFGQRANFEEDFSGEHLYGNYILAFTHSISSGRNIVNGFSHLDPPPPSVVSISPSFPLSVAK